mmetsp:Transcript_23793/g.34604  ORF Transcript_23793/g.34604 Transcript_23793/m.34604 type:complete len:266 (+) Transcript_23793:172-969(+)
MVAVRPPSNLIRMVAVSYASAPLSSSRRLSTWQDPIARISSGSQPMRKRDMSRSWMAMSLKMPPPPRTYSKGGGEGSREHSFTWMGSPTSPRLMASFTRAKFGSNRRCRAVISFTLATLHVLMASIVSGMLVAMGFSQKMCFPFLAHAVICSAWNCEGEHIHTASTSGCSMTSRASEDHSGTQYRFAAASALETVGLLIMMGWALGQLVSASKCTRPIRPAPIMPTLTTPTSLLYILGWRIPPFVPVSLLLFLVVSPTHPSRPAL